MSRSESRPAANGAAPKVTAATTASVRHGADIPVVTAWIYAAHPGRRNPVALVEECAHCGAAHMHRPKVIRPTMRRRCPVDRLPYVMQPKVRRLGRRRG